MAWEYIVLFSWSFLSATLLPLSSEAWFVYVVSASRDWFWPTLIAGAGNTLGSWTTYLIGRWGAKWYAKKYAQMPNRRRQQALRLLRRYGVIALVFSWVPFLGDVLVLIAGGLLFPMGSALLCIALGKFIRYGVLAIGVLQIL